MSQSATLYRISKDTFDQISKSHKEKPFDWSASKSYLTLQGSFMGLEYVLSKGRETSIAKLVNELFNPRQSLGKEEFEALTPEEKFDFL
jgi:hypothetical protein